MADAKPPAPASTPWRCQCVCGWRGHEYVTKEEADAALESHREAHKLGAPPPVEHPAPWRWDEDPTGDPALMDAAMNVLACTSQGQQWLASSRVLALTEAAPEMYDELGNCLAVFSLMLLGETPPEEVLLALGGRVRHLLARIDERSKGGD